MRSREEIMSQWDGVRRSIADGCTNNGPRDWLEGVLDEQDHAIANLVREISRLRHFEDESRARARWLDDAKRAAGYHVNVSFDEVWANALLALNAQRDARTVR